MRFLQSSVRYKLIALLLISTVIPIVASIFITYLYTKTTIKQHTIEENNRLISEGRTNIANFLDTVDSATMIPYSNAKLDKIMSKGASDAQDESYIYTALQLASRAAMNIYQVYLYTDVDQRSYLVNQDIFTRGYSSSRMPTAGSLAPYTAFTEATHPSHSYGLHPMPFPSSEPVFTIHQPLYRVPTSEQIGLLSIDVKLNALRSLSSQLYVQGKEDLYVIDKSGAILYASAEPLIGQKSEEPWIGRMTGGSESVGSFEWSGSDFSGIVIYSKIKSPVLEWTVAKRIPNHYLYEHARRLTWINASVAVLCLSIAMGAVLVVSIRLTNPIKQLIRSINKIQSGSLEEPISINRKDEFGILARRFRIMMRTINELILKEYKLDLANKTNQLKMLQAQINPHFINNALQSIGSSALDSDAPEVYSLVSSLGQMMHYSMNTKETIVPLAQEIDYVNRYLQLQQERFKNKLSVTFNIEEQSEKIPIPKMIIQPLVENFFKHGFHAMQGKGLLLINASVRNGFLIIEVEDNGPGISEERLLALRRDLSAPPQNPAEEENGIGLTNVMFRLRLYYGEQARMELATCVPHGLRITLTIPLNEQEGSRHDESIDRR